MARIIDLTEEQRSGGCTHDSKAVTYIDDSAVMDTNGKYIQSCGCLLDSMQVTAKIFGVHANNTDVTGRRLAEQAEGDVDGGK